MMTLSLYLRRMLLVYTSSLFLSVVVHAFQVQNAGYHHLFLIASVLSLAFHSQQQPHKLLHLTDFAVAHLAFAWVFLDLISMGLMRGAWPFPVLILALWILEHLAPAHRVPLHAGIHLTALACVHYVLLSKRSQSQ
jgi:hypothetical protein